MIYISSDLTCASRQDSVYQCFALFCFYLSNESKSEYFLVNDKFRINTGPGLAFLSNLLLQNLPCILNNLSVNLLFDHNSFILECFTV